MGDFRGIIEHLPYLRDLGVGAIRLTLTYINANALCVVDVFLIKLTTMVAAFSGHVLNGSGCCVVSNVGGDGVFPRAMWR